MTKNMIIEKKASKNDRSERSKSKNIEKAEFTDISSFEYNTLKRKIESVDTNISKRSKFNKNLNLTTSVLTNLNSGNEKISPISNSCIKEILLRTEFIILEMLNTYYTKG